MDTTTPTQEISAEDWSKLAALAETTPEELQKRYQAILSGDPESRQRIEVTRGDALQNGNCVKRDFNVSLFSVVGLSGNVEFCATSSTDWKAHFVISLDVAGASVWRTEYTLSPTNTSICYNPDVGAAKAQFCVGIVGADHCFNIKGNFCIWALIFGWQCADFNENLFCFG